MGLPVGTYSVCVTDLYGCSACDTTILSTGNCSAHFNLYPDTILHQYIAVNMTSGVPPFSYSWNWGDSAMNDTTAFPTHTYANAGFYNICLTITDSVGCMETYCNSFYLFKNTSANSMIRIIVRPPTITGILKRNEPDNILVFPNPASGFFIVKNIPPNSHPNLQIENLLGEKILELTNIQNERIVNYQLLPGVYLITIFDDAMKITKKLILQ